MLNFRLGLLHNTCMAVVRAPAHSFQNIQRKAIDVEESGPPSSYTSFTSVKSSVESQLWSIVGGGLIKESLRLRNRHLPEMRRRRGLA